MILMIYVTRKMPRKFFPDVMKRADMCKGLKNKPIK